MSRRLLMSALPERLRGFRTRRDCAGVHVGRICRRLLYQALLIRTLIANNQLEDAMLVDMVTDALEQTIDRVSCHHLIRAELYNLHHLRLRPIAEDDGAAI